MRISCHKSNKGRFLDRPLALVSLLGVSVLFIISQSALAQQSSGSSARHEQGREIYNFRCYYCHGYSGDARTLATTYLAPPPRNFRQSQVETLTRERMLAAVSDGRPGTAMKSFQRLLSSEEIAIVVDFVRNEFMIGQRDNTAYHTVENGWPDHHRYRAAYPFATGQIALDAPVEQLNDAQRRGRALFMYSCISCHDRARVDHEGEVWAPAALSYPRTGFKPGDSLLPPDAVSGATPFARHDIPPRVAGLSELEQLGEQLFQANCAFCHAADGTGRNWIGTFLEPHPRDLTDPEVMERLSSDRLRSAIADGVPRSSMPAWRSVLSAEQIDAIVRYIDRVLRPAPDASSRN